MMEIMREGGYMMWVILAASLLILGLSVWATVRTAKLSGPNAVLETAIDAVLFWGVWVVVIGLLGTFLGIYQAAGALEMIGGAASATLIWGGIKVSLTTTVFGLLVFSVAALLWMGLRARYRRVAGTLGSAV
jgi:biopolymer transport protein ExbB/TolQ